MRWSSSPHNIMVLMFKNKEKKQVAFGEEKRRDNCATTKCAWY